MFSRAFVRGGIAVALSALLIAGVWFNGINPWWLLLLIVLGAWGTGIVSVGATVEVKRQ